MEAVALEANLVKLDSLKHSAAVTLEAGRRVMHLEARDEPHVLRREIAHQHAPYGPVDNVHPTDVARAYGEVVALVVAGGVKARQVVRVVAEVGVHLEYVFILVLQRPLEARDVSRAKPQLARALDDEQAVAKLAVNQAMHDGGGAVGRAVVNHEDVETLFQREHRTYYFLDVFLFPKLLSSCQYFYS